MPAFLTVTGLAKLLQKVKTVFATKTEVTSAIDDADVNCVHKTGNETIAGTKTFSSKISGSINGSSASCTGNAATATKIQKNVGNGTYVGAATTGNALVNSTTTTFDAIWNAPTKNYQVACSTWPGNGDSVYLAYSVTKANISSGTNSVAKQCLWNADTGVLSASGGFSGNVTGNVTGNCSGTAANVTGTVAIANGGTGASSWGKGGYSSTANAKTVLGISGSDRRIKDDIEEIPDEVLDAWDNVKWNQFRMKKEKSGRTVLMLQFISVLSCRMSRRLFQTAALIHPDMAFSTTKSTFQKKGISPLKRIQKLPTARNGISSMPKHCPSKPPISDAGVKILKNA